MGESIGSALGGLEGRNISVLSSTLVLDFLSVECVVQMFVIDVVVQQPWRSVELANLGRFVTAATYVDLLHRPFQGTGEFIRCCRRCWQCSPLRVARHTWHPVAVSWGWTSRITAIYGKRYERLSLKFTTFRTRPLNSIQNQPTSAFFTKQGRRSEFSGQRHKTICRFSRPLVLRAILFDPTRCHHG